MDKKEFTRRPYVRPLAEVIKVNADAQIMAASPDVQPGVSVEDPKEDDDGTEISGAKKFNMWSGLED
ncbi:hypothetical protein ABVC70_04695 [Hoylesella timonensis]|uniref:hypothetical protein n=1 Tax=Hoylesella timonensis TaxID=386414 RepID=UPI003369F039